MEMADVAALILAAGASSRFGSPKLLARLGERTLLEAVVETAAREVTPVLAVVPPRLAVPPNAVPVINDRPELGLSHSLRLGLAAVPHDVHAALIMLGDQPTVRPTDLRRVLDGGQLRPFAAAAAEGRLGPPVLIQRSAFGLVDELSGDAGLGALLAARPELVTPVPVARHAPDVDAPEDLATLGEPCPGCGDPYPPDDGPTHAYIGASSGCWQAFSEVLAREFGDVAHGRVHRHSVAAYAAQHPGVDGPRQRQSVALHLVALCHWLEHGLALADLNRITQALADERRDWPWLEPPRGYRITVRDVLAARDADEHVRCVREWAESVWEAWSAHHGSVRVWAADASGPAARIGHMSDSNR
jgi:CTP:molybdopterin cytidylyltransferase MocA